MDERLRSAPRFPAVRANARSWPSSMLSGSAMSDSEAEGVPDKSKVGRVFAWRAQAVVEVAGDEIDAVQSAILVQTV